MTILSISLKSSGGLRSAGILNSSGDGAGAFDFFGEVFMLSGSPSIEGPPLLAFERLFDFIIRVHIMIFTITNTATAAITTFHSFAVKGITPFLNYISARNTAPEMLSFSSLSLTSSISSRRRAIIEDLVVISLGERISSISSSVTTWRIPSEQMK